MARICQMLHPVCARRRRATDHLPATGAPPTTLAWLSQDCSRATPADKIELAEGILRPRSQSAADCHSRCKAFAGWPGTRTTLEVVEGDVAEQLEVKVLATSRVAAPEGTAPGDVTVTKKAVVVTCACGQGLRLQRLQTPNKKPMDAASFVNGLRGRQLRVPEKADAHEPAAEAG